MQQIGLLWVVDQGGSTLEIYGLGIPLHGYQASLRGAVYLKEEI
jgi:hypothetical protein